MDTLLSQAVALRCVPGPQLTRPMDALGWTVEDVAAWLTRIGLPAGVTATFEAKQVDGPTLLELSDEDLHQSLAVEDVIHRRKIKGHIEALKLRAAQAATPSRNAYARSTPRRAYGYVFSNLYSNFWLIFWQTLRGSFSVVSTPIFASKY